VCALVSSSASDSKCALPRFCMSLTTFRDGSATSGSVAGPPVVLPLGVPGVTMGVVAAVPLGVECGGATPATSRAYSSLSPCVSSEPRGTRRMGKVLRSSYSADAKRGFCCHSVSSNPVFTMRDFCCVTVRRSSCHSRRLSEYTRAGAAAPDATPPHVNVPLSEHECNSAP
jgi:hypothetical protein